MGAVASLKIEIQLQIINIFANYDKTVAVAAEVDLFYLIFRLVIII